MSCLMKCPSEIRALCLLFYQYLINIIFILFCPQRPVNASSKNLFPIRKSLDSRCHLDRRHFLCVQDGFGFNGTHMRVHSSTKSFYTIVTNQSQLTDSSIFSSYSNETDDIARKFQMVNSLELKQTGTTYKETLVSFRKT
jgi:hypothetical protein